MRSDSDTAPCRVPELCCDAGFSKFGARDGRPESKQPGVEFKLEVQPSLCLCRQIRSALTLQAPAFLASRSLPSPFSLHTKLEHRTPVFRLSFLLLPTRSLSVPSSQYMDAPALTPNAASLSVHHQSSPSLSPLTTPELAPSSPEPERASNETCIFSIYSMYGEGESGWTIPVSTVDRQSRLQPDQQGRRAYIQASKLTLEDSGYSESSYDPHFGKHLLRMEQTRQANGTAFLAYADDDPRTSYYSTNQKNTPSRPQSQRLTTILSSTPPPTGAEPQSQTSSSGSSSDQFFLSPQTPDPSSSKPLSRVSSPRVSAVLSPPSPRESTLPPSQHPSQVVLIPHEGEDEDAFHVRRTYAELELLGVKEDGYAEGVERTRARVGSNRQSEIRALEALGDVAEKRRDLTPQEIEILASLDR